MAGGVPNQPAVVVEPRFAKVMPWILIVLGIVLALYAVAVRDDRHTDSVVEVEGLPTVQSGATGASGASSSKADGNPSSGDGLGLQKRTTTDKATSDTVFGSLLGLAALLALLGAFYSRVSKVTVAGNTIELNALSAQQDAEAIAAVVTEKVAGQLRERGADETVTVAQAAEIATRAASAAALAQQDAAKLRLAAATSATTTPPVVVEAEKLVGLSSGMPLPSDLLDRLADRAIKQVSDLEGAAPPK